MARRDEAGPGAIVARPAAPPPGPRGPVIHAMAPANALGRTDRLGGLGRPTCRAACHVFATGARRRGLAPAERLRRKSADWRGEDRSWWVGGARLDRKRRARRPGRPARALLLCAVSTASEGHAVIAILSRSGCPSETLARRMPAAAPHRGSGLRLRDAGRCSPASAYHPRSADCTLPGDVP